MTSSGGQKKKRTLHVRNGALEDLLLHLVVSQALGDLADDSLGEQVLLSLALLGLVADPRVEDLLDLGSDGGALLELEGVLLGLDGLLGDGVETLGHIHDIGLLRDLVDAVLHGLGVAGAGLVQDTGDLVDRRVSPVLVGLDDRAADESRKDQETSQDHGLVVGHVELVRDGEGGETGTEGDPGGLRDQRVTRERVNERRRLRLRGGLCKVRSHVLPTVGVEASAARC